MARRIRALPVWPLALVISCSHATGPRTSQPSFPVELAAQVAEARPVFWCLLVSSPELFAQQVVAVKGQYGVFYEGVYFQAEGCPTEMADVRFDPAVEALSPKDVLRRFKRLTEQGWRERRRGTLIDKHANVTFVGRIEASGPYGHLGNFKFRFTVLAITAAGPLPDVRPRTTPTAPVTGRR